MQQCDQPLAVGMQKADVARAPEPLGQHILQHQPEELRPWNRPALELPRLAIAVAETHLPVGAADEILLADDPRYR